MLQWVISELMQCQNSHKSTIWGSRWAWISCSMVETVVSNSICGYSSFTSCLPKLRCDVVCFNRPAYINTCFGFQNLDKKLTLMYYKYFSCILLKRNLIRQIVTITVYISRVNFFLQLLTSLLADCWYIIISLKMNYYHPYDFI